MHQPSLPGFAPAPREVHNLFFALWPDEATRARIASAVETLRAGPVPQGRWIKPSRYHLTLQFLGEHPALPEDLIGCADRAAARVDAAAFDIDLDIAGSFGNTRIPCWLGSSEPPPGLRVLHDALGTALREAGCRVVGGTSFTPHLTILRDADRPLQARLAMPLRWRVEEFVLIHSRTQPIAPYRACGRWRLR
jgi:2'-5' RNA ligase